MADKIVLTRGGNSRTRRTEVQDELANFLDGLGLFHRMRASAKQNAWAADVRLTPSLRGGRELRIYLRDHIAELRAKPQLSAGFAAALGEFLVGEQVDFSTEQASRSDASTVPWFDSDTTAASPERTDEKSDRDESIETDSGTVRICRWTGVDRYTGTGAALISLGLVRACELPGAPGVGQFMVTFSPDGTRIPRGGDGGRHPTPGHKQIRRVGAGRFRVSVHVSEEERNQRLALDARRHPRDIRPTSMELQTPRTAHLRLAWSAPPA